MIGRRDDDDDAGTAESEELDRLVDQLGRVEAPFDEITRSRAEAHLVAELAREPARRQRRTLVWTAALVAVGSAAAGALVARTIVPPARPRLEGGPALALQFEPYVVAPIDSGTLKGFPNPPAMVRGEQSSPAPRASAGAAVASAAVPEALIEPTSRLDVPAGWLVRASLGGAITMTLTGPARAWSERTADGAVTVVHLDQGRLLASLEGGAGRRLEIVSPGAVTRVVGTLFSVEVVGGASRVAVAHGRVQVAAAPGASDAPARAPREIAAGQSWLTTLPEPEPLEPALAEALTDHERAPPPRGATVPLSITEAPVGSGVWIGKRRIASTPAWVLVEPRATVRLSALAHVAAPSAKPSPPPSTEPAVESSHPMSEPSRPTSEPLARATTPTAPRPPPAPLTPPGGEPTEPPPVNLASVAPEEVTARSLFRDADAARAAGDKGLALRSLRALVERFPGDSATAAARYELALMEAADGFGEAALRDLAAIDTPALEEPTAYLRCRVLAKRAAGKSAEASRAEQCLTDFRRRFPASAHDADALATEAALALARGGCRAAQGLLAELERRHPRHGAAARLRAACHQAGRSQ